MFFDSWSDLIRICVVGSLAYVGLVLMLRMSGKRTLSKMNAFDLIVTVAFGSTLATVFLDKDTSLAEGLLALALLCVLQFVIALGAVHSSVFARLIKAEPAMLFYRGHFQRAAMARERVTEEELLAAARSSGYGSVEQIEAIVLETDGSFNVIGNLNGGPRDALLGVRGA